MKETSSGAVQPADTSELTEGRSGRKTAIPKVLWISVIIWIGSGVIAIASLLMILGGVIVAAAREMVVGALDLGASRQIVLDALGLSGVGKDWLAFGLVIVGAFLVVAGLVAVAFIRAGIRIARGMASDIRVIGISSILLGVFLLAGPRAVDEASRAAWLSQTVYVALILAGILALACRRRYKAWISGERPAAEETRPKA